MQVIILTHEIPIRPGLTEPTRKEIDWNNSSDRKWLMNHMHWAMHNSNAVHLTPVLSESN